jgi:hypothetical protein
MRRHRSAVQALAARVASRSIRPSMNPMRWLVAHKEISNVEPHARALHEEAIGGKGPLEPYGLMQQAAFVMGKYLFVIMQWKISRSSP